MEASSIPKMVTHDESKTQLNPILPQRLLLHAIVSSTFSSSSLHDSHTYDSHQYQHCEKPDPPIGSVVS